MVELASKDEELREETKNTVATIVMVLKDGEDTPVTISIHRGELRFSREGHPTRIFSSAKKGSGGAEPKAKSSADAITEGMEG